MTRSLNDSWMLGPIEVPNRVLLAPLAGIGNWCVRLQAKRHGAGLAISEMVSSHAIHHGNEKTLSQLLKTHPDEGPMALQLFGQEPEIMKSAAAYVREHVPGVDVIDLNMGCPVPKVMKTGAGAALLKDADTAVAVTKAAAEGSGLPVTVKLRSGQKQGDTSGYALAVRLVDEAGAAAITFHPRSANVHHKGTPDYDLAAKLVQDLGAPLILSGGMSGPDEVRRAWEHTGAEAIMLARGGLGNPWLFEQLLQTRPDAAAPTRAEILTELDWLMDRTVEHLGPERGARWMRKAYPWYVDRLGLARPDATALQRALQETDSVSAARVLLTDVAAPALS